MDKYLFIDVETTGLDPRKSIILEVSLRVVILCPNDNKYKIINSFDLLIDYSLPVVLSQINSYDVLKMHYESGLLKDIEDLNNKFEEQRSLLKLNGENSYLLDDPKDIIIEFINNNFDESDTIIFGGHNVYYDIESLKYFICVNEVYNELWNNLNISHRKLDTCPIKLMLQDLNGGEFNFSDYSENAKYTHRSSDDVDACISLLNYSLGKLK